MEENKSLVRDSNMELARIVAMTMIVVGHFLFHGVFGTVIPSPLVTPKLGVNECVIHALSILCTAGVDLFMLISGYYGIRLRWQSLLSFWLLCTFYNMVNLFANTPFSEICVSNAVSVLFISRTPNWFFQGYFWVLLCSPILNKSIKELDIRALRCVVALGTVLICLSSWRFGNPKGNTALLLMFVYVLGGYIKREDWFEKVTGSQALLSYFLLCMAGLLLSIFVFDVFHKEYGIFFQHNSLLVVIMAVCLFLFFRQCNVHSRLVNTWASTVVAAIFIQDIILPRPLYSYVNNLYNGEGLSVHLWIMIVALTVAIFVVAFIVELLRRKVAEPISKLLSDYLNRIINLGKILDSEGSMKS